MSTKLLNYIVFSNKIIEITLGWNYFLFFKDFQFKSFSSFGYDSIRVLLFLIDFIQIMKNIIIFQ